MSLAVAIQMDPMETVDMMSTAASCWRWRRRRRPWLFHYLPRHLFFREQRVLRRRGRRGGASAASLQLGRDTSTGHLDSC